MSKHGPTLPCPSLNYGLRVRVVSNKTLTSLGPILASPFQELTRVSFLEFTNLKFQELGRDGHALGDSTYFAALLLLGPSRCHHGKPWTPV